MKQNQKTIRNEIKKLRVIIDTNSDPIETRIAYAVECALRWSIEDTEGWMTPSEDVFEEAKLLSSKQIY